MTSIKRDYKSSMFCMLWERKEELLSLYNTVNGTHYTNAEDLTTNTLRNAIYVGMKNCKQLREYVLYIEKVRTYVTNMPIEDAVNRAVDECIAENILSDFLSQHKAEAIAMSIFEYNQEAHLKCVRQEGYEEGLTRGKELGITQGITQGFTQGIAESIIELLVDLDTIPDDLRRKILLEANIQRLKAWHKLAAKVTSIEEFMDNF